MKNFFDTYVLPDLQSGVHLSVLDIGGMNVNGSYRSLFSHPGVTYLAADLESGPGVDMVLRDPYRLPFADASFDVVISGQTLEHSPRFWELAAEMGRVLKPSGTMALICPSAGPIHRYPVDCYRFLPDSMDAIAALAGLEALQIEHRAVPPWNDLVGIMRKPGAIRKTTPAAVSYDYLHVLEFLHHVIRPRTYFEIGTDQGASLTLARCASIAVDPVASSRFDVLGFKAGLKYFAQTSDAFFASVDLAAEFSGLPADLAFIDGFHTFDQVLRDFFHLEPYCAPETVVCFHDVLPRTEAEADRDRRTTSWAGDVWKAVDILRHLRPQLRYACLDVKPTGLLLVTGFSSDRNPVDLEGFIDRHIRQPYPSLEELKAAFGAMTPERFFSDVAPEFLHGALRGEDVERLLLQGGTDMHAAVQSVRTGQWRVDEPARLISQVRLYPLYPSTWRDLVAHLRTHQDFSMFFALAAEHEDAFNDATVGWELQMIMADVHQERGDLAAAAAALTKACELDARNPAPRIRLSRVHDRRGDLEKAIRSAREAIALKDDVAAYHHHLGNLLLRAGDPDGALRSQHQALELNPDLPGCHYTLSQIHNRQGNLDQAVHAAREAVALKDDVPSYHHHLGNLLLRAGDPDGAVRFFERALELNADLPDCHFKLSQIQARRNDLTQAMASVRAAIALKDDVPSYHHHLGNLLLRAGDPEGAVRFFERALELDDTLQGCRAQLERIRARHDARE